eukprot:1024672-Prymnesium_polylepis.2
MARKASATTPTSAPPPPSPAASPSARPGTSTPPRRGAQRWARSSSTRDRCVRLCPNLNSQPITRHPCCVSATSTPSR